MSKRVDDGMDLVGSMTQMNGIFLYLIHPETKEEIFIPGALSFHYEKDRNNRIVNGTIITDASQDVNNEQFNTYYFDAYVSFTLNDTNFRVDFKGFRAVAEAFDFDPVSPLLVKRHSFLAENVVWSIPINVSAEKHN